MAVDGWELALAVLLWCCAIDAGGALKICPGSGVQYHFTISSLPAGWTVHYDEEYSHATTMANIRPGSGDCILWAARREEQPDRFEIVGFADRVAVETQSHVWINGIYWYTSSGQSNGFASTSNIVLGPGDDGPFSCFARLSWLLDRGEGGYRAGCDTISLLGWRKVVMFGPEVQTCELSVCGEGTVLKISDMPEFCSGVACTQDECCENAGVCNTGSCGGTYVLKKADDQPRFCAGTICSQNECCMQAPKCNTTDCSYGYSLRTIRQGLPTQCLTHTCSQDECCIVNPPCSSSSCDLGFVLRPSGLPWACATQVCQNDECCGVAGRCSVDVCLGEYVYLSEWRRPAFCAGMNCTRQECCGGFLAPSEMVLGAEFVDLDLDSGEVAGSVTWRPPSSDRVESYNVYLGSAMYDKTWMGNSSYGTNSLSIPLDTASRLYLYIYCANEGGESPNAATFPINDTNYLPTDLRFSDLDLDQGEVGGTVAWDSAPPKVSGILQGYNVYLATDVFGYNRSFLGVASGSADRFVFGPDAPFWETLTVFPFSSLGERTVPAALAIIDNLAYVEDLRFEPDPAVLSATEVKGLVTWKEPSDKRYVTAYRVYLASSADGLSRMQIGPDYARGTVEADIPARTEKRNFTHILVYSVSSFAEQGEPAGISFAMGGAAAALAAGALGLAAAGRAASAAAGANAASNAVEGMNMEKMERMAVRTSNQTNKEVTALGSFVNKHKETFRISGFGGEYFRSLFHSLLPCCIHHHHSRVTLQGPEGKQVLRRLNLCENTWDNEEVLLKKLSNSYYSVAGLTSQPFLLKRRVPKSRIFSPMGLSGIMVKGIAPIIALLIIALVVCGMKDWMTGAILGVAACAALCMVLFAKPGGLVSQCIDTVVNSPPARIRDGFWSCVGLFVGILPSAPAFMAGTAIGYCTGITCVLGAVLSFLGRDVVSMALQFFAGVALTLWTLALAFLVDEEEGEEEVKVDVFMFVSAALVVVSGMDNYVKNSAAKFKDVDLATDEIVEAAEQSAKDIGVTLTDALALEAFITGHMEGRLQERLITALEGLAKEAVALSKAVLNFLVDEVQEQGVERARKNFEKRIPKLIFTHTPLATSDVGIVADACEEISIWEDFEMAFGKLLMDCFTEKFIKDCRKSQRKVRDASVHLQGKLESMKRLAGLDFRASHHVTMVVIGHRAESVKEIADDLKQRVPADGNLMDSLKFQEKLDLMGEDFSRIVSLLSALIHGAGEESATVMGNSIEKLEKARATAAKAGQVLENMANFIQPGAALTAENESIALQHLSAVSEAAGSVRGLRPKLQRATTMHLSKSVLQEAEDELPQLAHVKSEDDRADIVSAYCTARSSAAVTSVVADEVASNLERVEVALELLTEGRVKGLNILKSLRDAREVPSLHLLGVRDEVMDWMARYPQRIWTRIKVLHYSVDRRFSDSLGSELERTVSRDMRHSISRSFSVLAAETKGRKSESQWAAKIFGPRRSRVHPEEQQQLQSPGNVRMTAIPSGNIAGRMTGGSTAPAPSYRNTQVQKDK